MNKLGNLVVVFCAVGSLSLYLALGYAMMPQDIPGHEEVTYTIAITYVGPRDAIMYDTQHQRELMLEFPQIFCEGDFKYSYITNDTEDQIEVVCHYDWTPGKVRNE